MAEDVDSIQKLDMGAGDHGPSGWKKGTWRRRSMLAAVTILISSLVRPVFPAQGQVGEWTPAVRLSPVGVSAWFPDIAADPFGQIHVVWASGEERGPQEWFDVVFYRSRLSEEPWADPIDITAKLTTDGSSYATRPYLSFGPNGLLQMTFRDSDGLFFTRATRPVVESAHDWVPPVPISPYAYYSDVETDKNGRIHLLYTENAPTDSCEICFHVYYRRSDNNGRTWSVPMDISRLPMGAAKPTMLVQEDGEIQVAWEAGNGGDLGQLEGDSEIRYVHSRDGSDKWSAPLRISNAGVNASNPVLGQDPEGQLLAIWESLDTGEVQYRVSLDQGRHWSDAQAIGTIVGKSLTRLDGYDIARDSLGKLHLILVGGQAGSILDSDQRQVLHLSWDGFGWSQPDVVAEYRGDLPEWPRLAVSSGNVLHAVWFVRDEEHIWESDLGRYRVMYASRTLDAPATALQPLPSPTEPFDVLATESSSVSPTPVSVRPTPAPGFENGKRTLVQEQDYMMLFLVSTVPTTVLLGLAGWLIRRRNR